MFYYRKIFFPARRKRVKHALDRIYRLMDSIIAERLKRQQEVHSNGEEQDDSRPRDLLDILLGAREGEDAKLSAQELRDHTLTFLAAGHETTSTTILWTLYELVQNPEVLQV